MTKEEYKKNVIRMWDSLRTERKGEENCVEVACGDCPLYKKACGPFYVFEALELVEKWAEEHHIKTNADKFKEVFGLDMAPIHSCVNPKGTCSDCKYSYEDDCYVSDRFWNAEYVEPRKEGEL